jgi:hypothetical protein
MTAPQLITGGAVEDGLAPQLLAGGAGMEDGLAPQLLAALSVGGEAGLLAICERRGGGALALPLLSAEACAAMEQEVHAFIAAHPRSRIEVDESTAGALPVTARVAQVLFELLPRLCPALGGKFASTPLCDRHKVYVLRYAAHAGLNFGERVFVPHTDDSDVTLNVAFGSSSGWTGSALVYIESSDGRPGTPNLATSATHRHSHSLGTAVLHGEGAYHYVEPLIAGERLSLLVLAMRDDAEWKRTYLGGAGAPQDGSA